MFSHVNIVSRITVLSVFLSLAVPVITANASTVSYPIKTTPNPTCKSSYTARVCVWAQTKGLKVTWYNDYTTSSVDPGFVPREVADLTGVNSSGHDVKFKLPPPFTINKAPTTTYFVPLPANVEYLGAFTVFGANQDTIALVVSALTDYVVTNALTSASTDKPYSFSLRAAGGVKPYKWVVTSLPKGMTVDKKGKKAGQISGIPSRKGVFPLNVTVTDQNGLSASTNLSLVVR